MKSINQQLNPNLVSKAHHLELLTSILNRELPPETAGHYHVAGLDNSTLVIITDAPVWTARLRQLGPSIINILTNEINSSLQHVKIVSRHGSIKAPQQEKPIINRILSEQSSQQLAQTAEYIKDTALKSALLKIAKRGEKKD